MGLKEENEAMKSALTKAETVFLEGASGSRSMAAPSDDVTALSVAITKGLCMFAAVAVRALAEASEELKGGGNGRN
jgi:hypothetical protein